MTGLLLLPSCSTEKDDPTANPVSECIEAKEKWEKLNQEELQEKSINKAKEKYLNKLRVVVKKPECFSSDEVRIAEGLLQLIIENDKKQNPKIKDPLNP
jgi:uncharacterized protein YfkK (UPF0435 family)